MNKNPLVSIVVPAYNVSKYIEECLNSLINQSYFNVEVIVIDDGSVDNTYDIVECYSNLDSRVKVYRYENSGLSVARNRGLSKVQGSYVMFLDSDDYLDLDTIEYCINLIVAQKLKAVYFDRESFSDGDVTYSFCTDNHRKLTYCNKTMTGEEFYDVTIKDKTFLSSACYAIFDISTLWSECFIDGILHEDEIFTSQVLTSGKIDRLHCLSKKFYKRRIREDSIMTASASLRNVEGYLTVARELLCMYGDLGLNTLHKHANSMFYMACFKASKCKKDKHLAVKELLSFVVSSREFRFRPENYVLSLLPSLVLFIKKIKAKINA